MKRLLLFSIVIIGCSGNKKNESISEKVSPPVINKRLNQRLSETFNEINYLAKSSPSTPQQFKGYSNFFKSWSAISAECFKSADKNLKDSASKLNVKIIAKQKELLPYLRKEYGQLLARLLWREDIIVKSSGQGNTILNMTGGYFVRNKNIEESYKSIYDVAHSLRFKKVIFRWSNYASEFTYYNLFEGSDSDL